MPDNNEIFNNVLAVTRDQLSKSMGLNAELEAMLMIERKKVADLEKQLEEAKKEKK
jgi:hypothetical protein